MVLQARAPQWSVGRRYAPIARWAPRLASAVSTVSRLSALRSLSFFGDNETKLGRRCVARTGSIFRPREAGEGDHWSSRSERTVVEGAPGPPLRCCRGTLKGDKLDAPRA